MNRWLGTERVWGLPVLCAAVLLTSPCGGQSRSRSSTPDTGVALTPEMRLLDERLLERTREPLERFGNTFRSFAFYVPDTAGPMRVLEIGLENSVDSRQPSVVRDSLREVMRRRQRSFERARTVGVITDSIAGPVEEALDGAEGPDFDRKTITELEDVSGQCRRIERDYHFARKPAGWGFGTVIYGQPRVTRCEPFNYWPPGSTSPRLPSRRLLAAPIRKSLDISSVGVSFTVVGEFHGRLTVFDDSIVVRFDSLVAMRRLPGDVRTVKLDSIRVGLGVGDEESWSPLDDSKALRVGRVVPPGGQLVRRKTRFVIRHERRDEDANAWIVLTFHITTGQPGTSDYQPNATTYAHSKKGILMEPSN